MTKEEFSEYAKALRTFYPKEKLLQTQDSMKMWYKQLKDVPYENAESHLDEWSKHNKWSPSIAEIIEGSQKVIEAGAYSIGMDDFIKMLEAKE